MNVTRELRKGHFLAAKRKLIGWGARIYTGRAAMLGKRGRKMTQQELGDASDCSAQQISRYEDETDEPNYDRWIKMARALLMTPGELMFGHTHVPLEEGMEVAVPSPTRSRRKV